MPPPGYEPFLSAICADPADDTVRLAYADWLDENGDPARAEFIRCQVAAPDFAHRSDARYLRAKQIHKVHGTAWRAELPFLRGVEWGTFHRGFVRTVTFQNARFVDPHCDAVFAAAPIQCFHSQVMTPDTFCRFVAGPYLPRLTELETGYELDDECVRLLAADPRAAGLESLTLSGGPVTRGGVIGPYRTLTDGTVELLTEPSVFPILRRLTLSGWEISPRSRWELRLRFQHNLMMFPHATIPPPGTPPA